jgi:DNA repair exonuclease SbcCD nuclease subunit
VVITQDEIAASGLDYLALGHWHGAQVAKARGVTYAYSGAPEPVALDQDKAGKVLLVTLDTKGEDKTVKVDERTVGKTTFEHREIDAATVESQPAFVAKLRAAPAGRRARRAADRQCARTSSTCTRTRSRRPSAATTCASGSGTRATRR